MVEIREKMGEIMFFGYYEHNLDDRNRLMIPSKIRDELKPGEVIYAVKGFDGCLAIYSEAGFENLMKEVKFLSNMDKEARTYLRILLSSVTPLNLDKLGRISLPVLLTEKHHIKKSVVVLGINDHFEIWDKELYEAYQKEHEAKFEDVADMLVKRNGEL